MQYLIIGLIGTLALISAILGFISVAKSTSSRSMLFIAALLSLLSVILIGFRTFYREGWVSITLTLLAAVFMLTAGIVYIIATNRASGGRILIIVATITIFSALIILGGDYGVQRFKSSATPAKDIAPSFGTQPLQTIPESVSLF